VNRKADIKMIMGALKEQRRLSPRTIKRIEAGLKVAPAAESFKNAFALCGRSDSSRGFLGGLGRFHWAFSFEGGSLCHGVGPYVTGTAKQSLVGATAKRSSNRQLCHRTENETGGVFQLSNSESSYSEFQIGNATEIGGGSASRLFAYEWQL